MKKRKLVSVLVLLLVSVSLLFGQSAGAVAEVSSGVNGDVESDWVSYGTEHIEGTRRISAVTGRYATTNTQELFDVGGTDLGIPFTYTYKNEAEEEKTELRILFGDTFSTEYLQGVWRSNVMAITEDFDFSDGITIDSFVSTDTVNGFATELIPGIHVSQQQMTAIPTGAMQIGDAIYVYYMGVRVWGDDGEWWNNLGGVYKSTDGQTFSRVESMYIYANKMANFTQNYPLVVDEDHDGTDDWLYVFGISGGRSSGLRCMRVSLKGENDEVLTGAEQQARVENLDNYTYFNGYENGEPTWIPYNEHYMALVWNYSEEAEVISAPCGEMSICYNPYLGKYMATYQQHNTLIMKLADTPYGPYGKSEIILTSSDFNTFYNAFTTSAMLKDDGKTVYFLMSQWPRSDSGATLNYFVGLMEMKLK